MDGKIKSPGHVRGSISVGLNYSRNITRLFRLPIRDVVRSSGRVELCQGDRSFVDNDTADGFMGHEGQPDIIFVIKDHGDIFIGVEATVEFRIREAPDVITAADFVLGGDKGINTVDLGLGKAVNEGILSQVTTDRSTVQREEVRIQEFRHQLLGRFQVAGCFQDALFDLSNTGTGQRALLDSTTAAIFGNLGGLVGYSTDNVFIDIRPGDVFHVHDVFQHLVVEHIQDIHLVPFNTHFIDFISVGHNAVEADARLAAVDHAILGVGFKAHHIGAGGFGLNFNDHAGQIGIFKSIEVFAGYRLGGDDLTIYRVFADLSSEVLGCSKTCSFTHGLIAQHISLQLLRESKFLTICHHCYISNVRGLSGLRTGTGQEHRPEGQATDAILLRSSDTRGDHADNCCGAIRRSTGGSNFTQVIAGSGSEICIGSIGTCNEFGGFDFTAASSNVGGDHSTDDGQCHIAAGGHIWIKDVFLGPHGHSFCVGQAEHEFSIGIQGHERSLVDISRGRCDRSSEFQSVIHRAAFDVIAHMLELTFHSCS